MALRAPAKDRFQQVAQLLRSEFVTLQVSHQMTSAVENHSVQGVSNQPLVLPKVHAKFKTDLLDFGGRPSQKVPTLCVGGLPIGCIVCQDFGLIVFWIKGNAQKHQVAVHAIRKTLLYKRKIIRKAKTKIGKRAVRIQKC